MSNTIELLLTRPHAAQGRVIEQAKRFNAVCRGRRWGKTVLGMEADRQRWFPIIDRDGYIVTKKIQPEVQEEQPEAPSMEEVDVQQGCRYCGGTLPEGRNVTFCPHCGLNLSTRRCDGCGTEFEGAWRFCVNCGKKVA